MKTPPGVLRPPFGVNYNSTPLTKIVLHEIGRNSAAGKQAISPIIHLEMEKMIYLSLFLKTNFNDYKHFPNADTVCAFTFDSEILDFVSTYIDSLTNRPTDGNPFNLDNVSRFFAQCCYGSHVFCDHSLRIIRAIPFSNMIEYLLGQRALESSHRGGYQQSYALFDLFYPIHQY